VGVLIDTDVFIEVERSASRPLDEIVGEEPWAISVITVSELLQGVHRATAAVRTRRAAWVEALLAGTEAVPITTPVARVHSELWAFMAARGSVIGQHDLWIGATALTHGLSVVTRNERDFARLPGLHVLTI
jgi:predicted nucleic acid-binding protein